MNLEQVVRDAPKFRVVTRGETARETARNVYDVALSVAGLQEGEDQGDGVVMALRASWFLVDLLAATERVGAEIYKDLGLIGGATGRATFADLKHLDSKQSLQLHQITAAVLELKAMKPDLLMILRQIREQREAA